MSVQSNTETASTPSSQDRVSAAAKMDPALKAKWIEALRSGEYEQGKMQLRQDGKFCCLGVLCVVAGMEIDRLGEEVLRDGLKAGYSPLSELLGANELAPLYSKNDRGTPFPEIADYIEQNL